jgi:hypothetical protein
MQGINVAINTTDDLTAIKFNLYDNDVQVMTDIDQPNFAYLTDDLYGGFHTLELSYYKDDNLDIESGRFPVLAENFTAPALAFTVTWSIISD